MDNFLPIGDSTILNIQQILAHIITRDRPRGTKPKNYAKIVRKFLMFFNNLSEDILMKNYTYHKFQIGQTFLKELQWVFSDEMALLIHDALCGKDDEFKVDIKKTESLEGSVKESCNRVQDRDISEQVERLPSERKLKLEFSLDTNETQFTAPEMYEKISRNLPNQRNFVTINEEQGTENIQNVQNRSESIDDFKILSATNSYFHHRPDVGISLKMKPLYALFGTDTNEKPELECLGKMEAESFVMNLSGSGHTDQPIFRSTVFDKDRTNTKLQKILLEQTFDKENKMISFENVEKQRSTINEKKITHTSQIVLDYPDDNTNDTEPETKALDFHPLDYETISDLQMGEIVRKKIDTSFLDCLQEHSNVMEEDKSRDHITFLGNFCRIANQFNKTLNSKMSLGFLNSYSFDDLVLKTSFLQINGEMLNGSLSVNSSMTKNKSNQCLQWDCVKAQNTMREKKLKNLLQKIFEYLHELLKNVTKFHSSVVNWQNFLVNRVFSDIRQYYDEELRTCADDCLAEEMLNICCGFIKTAVEDIFSSVELNQFLRWEEQCSLLMELCNSKLVCQNILEFLLARAVLTFKNLEEQGKNQNKNSFQDPAIVEKLSLVFMMMKNLVKKYAELYLSEAIKMKDEGDKEDKNKSELLKLHAFAEQNNFDFDGLQDTNEENMEGFKAKWIECLEKIIQLTKDRLNLFYFLAQEILQILKEAKVGGNETFFELQHIY